MKDIQRNAPIMLGLGIWYPVYSDSARIKTPDRAWAGASDLNAAANMRKKARNDTATVKTNSRKVLRVVRRDNDFKGRGDLQVLARGSLQVYNKVEDDSV